MISTENAEITAGGVETDAYYLFNEEMKCNKKNLILL